MTTCPEGECQKDKEQSRLSMELFPELNGGSTGCEQYYIYVHTFSVSD